MVIPIWLILDVYEGGVVACWWVCTVFLTLLGIGFLLRFLGGKWKSMQVIEPLVDDDSPATADSR